MDALTPSEQPASVPLGQHDGVSYCINPHCRQMQAIAAGEVCRACGTSLLVHGKYRLIRSLRAMNPFATTEIFEVESWPDRTRKVMKVLKDTDPQTIERFEREALALQWLDHPGIPKAELGDNFTVEVPATGEVLHCLVMEKIAGENLETWVKQHGPIDQKTAIAWLKQLLEVLEVLHENQFFHRDIKPSNIMRRPDGQLVLIDFGSVRTMTTTYLASVHARAVTTPLSVGYTPQEQLDGQAVPQSDLFALGRTFVYLLTGLHPADIPYKTANNQLLWRDQAPQISPALKDLIDELMALRPTDRPASAAVVHRHLSANDLRLTDIKLFFNSRKFKLGATLLLGLGILTLATYRISLPFLGRHYFDLAQEALKNNQLDRAEKYYQKAKNYNPNDSRIYNNLGFICQRRQDRVCAEAMYAKSLELEPNDLITQYNVAELNAEAGNFAKAKEQYHSIIQSRSQTNNVLVVTAMNNLARLEVIDGNLEEAISLASKGLKKATTDLDKAILYKNRGWAYYLQGNYELAIADLELSIKLGSDRADAYCLLAQILQEQGNQRASSLWKDCLKYGSPNEDLEVKLWKNLARKFLNIQEAKDEG